MAKRFQTNRALRKMYDACRTAAADQASEFWYHGKPHRGAGHRVAYWNGRTPGHKWLGGDRSTFAYACWRAGRDDLTTLGPVAGSEPR